MNYIISGGAGFIGRNLVHQLPKPYFSTILDISQGQDQDLRTSVITVPLCDTFIHLAAITDVRYSLLHPQKVILDNCKMTLNALEYAKYHNSHFIFTSSMGAPELLSPYSASKLACEAFCTTYRKTFGVKVNILRLSNVYGPHSAHKTSVIPKFIKQCIDRNDLEIYGNGFQTRDFIHVDDVIDTISNCAQFNPLNVASGTAISILELAEIIRHFSIKYLSYEPKISHLPAIKGEIKKVKLSTDIRSTISIHKGLETTFKWFVENYHAK
jgi:UDP-glucose 4-epimerase